MTARTTFSDHSGAVSPRLRILILGSAAGGGLPQWNCGCPNCRKARQGQIPARTQSSIAVSANGEDWALINASPDLRGQLAASPALHPRDLRHSPIRSVILTNGDLDHIAGLLTLRERQAFTLYCTAEIAEILAANRVFGALDPKLVERRAMVQGEPLAPVPGITAELFQVPGKVPLFLEEGAVVTDKEDGQTVGVRLVAGGATAFYIPGCARLTAELIDQLRGADLVLFDGTLWRDDEMIRMGMGEKTGRRMGHMPISGSDGSMAALAGLRIGRRVYIHMNNTNPVLDPTSHQHRDAEAAGWTIAEDGMELYL